MPRSYEILFSTLVAVATDLLVQICHPAIVAMLRLGVAEAERSPEVARALQECREANRGMLAQLLAHAQSAGLLALGPTGELARQFLALVDGDLVLDLLLGVAVQPSRQEIERRAIKVSRTFL